MSTTTDTNRTEHETALGAKLSEWGDEIDRLSAQAESAKGEMREELDKEIEALRQKREEARVKLDSLRRATDDAWEDMKEGLERAWSDIHLAVEQARARYDQGTTKTE